MSREKKNRRRNTTDSLNNIIASGKVSYHNTSGLTGQAQIKAEQVARNQDVICFVHMSMPDVPTSASQLFERLHQRNAIGVATPITSIRRSLSNLVRKGFAEKLDEQVDGPLGKPEHLYQIRAKHTGREEPKSQDNGSTKV